MIEMIWRTRLAPWEFESLFPGSFISIVLVLFLSLLKGALSSKREPAPGIVREQGFTGENRGPLHVWAYVSLKWT